MAKKISPPVPPRSIWTVADLEQLPADGNRFEVLSPSTAKTDRHRKRPAYLAHGVADVWLVDIDAQSVERWTAQSEFPQLHRTTFAWAASSEAPSLTIELAELFGVSA